MTVGPVPVTRDSARLGIIYMLGAVFLFALVNVVIKWTSARYPVLEVSFFRAVFALIPTGILVALQGGWPLLRTSRPGGHLFRGLIGVTSMLLMFYAYHKLPLADAVALSFAGPLFLTALSVPLLGERVGLFRWSAVLVGFAGVLVMTNPSGAMANLGTLAAVASAAAYALAMIFVRQLSRSEHPVTIALYFTVIATIVTGATLPFVWQTPSLPDLALLAVMGVTAGIAQYFVTQAYRHGAAAVVSPFTYTGLIWAGFAGYLVWGDIPSPNVFAGAAIVVVSGLFILYRETVRRAPVTKLAPDSVAHE